MATATATAISPAPTPRRRPLLAAPAIAPGCRDAPAKAVDIGCADVRFPMDAGEKK
jgi:hypothetical protein